MIWAKDTILGNIFSDGINEWNLVDISWKDLYLEDFCFPRDQKCELHFTDVFRRLSCLLDYISHTVSTEWCSDNLQKELDKTYSM